MRTWYSSAVTSIIQKTPGQIPLLCHRARYQQTCNIYELPELYFGINIVITSLSKERRELKSHVQGGTLETKRGIPQLNATSSSWRWKQTTTLRQKIIQKGRQEPMLVMENKYWPDSGARGLRVNNALPFFCSERFPITFVTELKPTSTENNNIDKKWRFSDTEDKIRHLLYFKTFLNIFLDWEKNRVWT